MSKQTWIAIAIIGLIIVLMQSKWYQKQAFPQLPDTLHVESEQNQTDGHPVTEPVQTTLRESTPAESESPLQNDDHRSQRSESLFSPVEAAEREIEIQTDGFTARISNRGAVFTYFGLKRYKSYTGDEVVLIDSRKTNVDPIFTVDGGMMRFSDFVFETDAGDLDLRGRTEPVWLSFSLTDTTQARSLRKDIYIDPQSYYLKAVVTAEGFDRDFLFGTYRIRWDTPLEITDPDTTRNMVYTEALALTGGSNLDEFVVKKGPRKMSSTTGQINWVGKRSKYFEFLMIPETRPGSEVTYTGFINKVGEKPLKTYQLDLKLNMPNPDRVQDTLTLYMGPLDNKMLKQADAGLEKTIMTKATFGMMKFMWPVIKPFAFFALYVFRILHLFIHNYGIIIIIFSVLIKLIVWPLTHKSHKSMKEMQNIQPLIKDLRAKYKNDPRRLQSETMKLYQEHGVNPFGSCLPTLLQMPLLFALFFVFRSAFELRGAAFFWWITDLSQPDVLFHLPFSIPLYGSHVAFFPLVMGITTYLQTKMSATDPNQKMMLYFMPIMLVVLFNNFPSGLTMYYTLFNLLTIYQQRLVYKSMDGRKMTPKKKVRK